mgnify:CR=1 FL=1
MDPVPVDWRAPCQIVKDGSRERDVIDAMVLIGRAVVATSLLARLPNKNLGA